MCKSLKISVHDIVDYFVMKVDVEAHDVMTHLKIQKLLYYAQGWCLAIYSEKLFDDKILAWQHGPVVRSVFDRFKDKKWDPIAFDDVTDRAQSLPVNVKVLLDDIWTSYGQFSAKRLEDMTHSEDPWKDAFEKVQKHKRGKETIPVKSMKAFFSPKLIHK